MRRGVAAAAAAGLLLTIGIGAVALLQQRLDPEVLRRAVIASVERQSGRTMTLGRLDVRLLPWPHVSADRLTLGDRPGAADPVMLRIGHVEAGIGLWPLLRHVVRLDGLRLDHVGLRVLRDADGHGNWEMGPRPVAGAGGTGAGPGASYRGTSPWGVAFDDVRIDTAELSLRDEMKRRGATLHLATLAGSGLQGDQPHFSLAGEQGGAGYAVDGDIGPVRRLLDGSDRRTEWPVSLRASETVSGAEAGRAEVRGAIADPAHGRGYDLALTARIAQLSELNRLFTHAGLPAVQGLDASGRVVDSGHPALAALRANAGLTEIGGIRGLVARNWSIVAPAAAAPVDVSLSGSWRGQAVVLKGSVASLDAVQAGRTIPMPVRLSLGLGTTSWQLDGLAGASRGDLRLRGSIPDPRALAAEAPDTGPVTLAARLQAGPGRSFRVSELQLNSAAGDLAGAMTLSLEGRPLLAGALHSTRIDLDRMASGHSAGRTAGAAPPAAAARAAGTAGSPAAERVLPWPLLRLADADLSLQVADLRIGGAPYRDFTTHAVLHGGRLLMQPFQAAGPAGIIAARLQLDAAGATPGLGIWMHPAMLPATLLARLLGWPAALRGTIELVGELQAGGATRSALVGSATGHLGVSMTDGMVANAGLLRLVGGSSAIAAVLPLSGETAVRCLAVHATVAGAQAVVDTLSLRTGQLSLDGRGRVAMPDGRLDLHLLPDVRVGGTWISLPIQLGGTLRDPQPKLDHPEAGGHTPGRYALTIGGEGNAGSGCEAPLQAAREGVAGPAASAMVGGKQKSPKPIDILRSLGILH